MCFTNEDKVILKSKIAAFCRACINVGKCDGNEEVDCPVCPMQNAYDMVANTNFEEEA